MSDGMRACLQCEQGAARLIPGTAGLMQMFCRVTGEDSGPGCADFVRRATPLVDPRGWEYSPEYFKLMAARSLCARVLDGTFAYFMAQVRQRQGGAVADEMEAAGRNAWRSRREWMTAEQLEAADRVRV